jgi:hypothetical protein
VKKKEEWNPYEEGLFRDRRKIIFLLHFLFSFGERAAFCFFHLLFYSLSNLLSSGEERWGDGIALFLRVYFYRKANQAARSASSTVIGKYIPPQKV